jgi:O-antigen/teichoic acid export membrane protein
VTAADGATGDPIPQEPANPVEEDEVREIASRAVVGRNIVVLLASQLVTWSLAFVLAVFEPRFLGPAGLGQLRTAMAMWSIANVFAELGVNTLLVLEFARDPRRARALLAPAVRLRAAAEVLAAACIAVVVAVLYDADTAVIVAIVGIGLVIASFTEIARSALYGLQSMGITARVDIVVKVVLVVVVVSTLLAGGGAKAVATVWIIPQALACWLLWRALRERADRSTGVEPIREVTVLRRSAPYLVSAAVSTVYSQTDIIVISAIATVDEAGWYAAAATLFGSLLFIPTTFTTSLFPALAQLNEEGPERALRLLARSVRSMLLLAVPMGLGTVVVGDEVATTVLGSDFDGSGPVLSIYGVVLIVMFLTILFGRFAFAIGRHRIYITAMAVGAALTIPLDLALVAWTHDQFDNGAIGGALTTAITETMLLGVSVVFLAPGLLDRATGVRVLKVGLAGAALVAASWPFRHDFLAIPIVLGAVAYLVVGLVLRILDDDEKHMLRRLWQKVHARLRRPGDGPPAIADGSPA